MKRICNILSAVVLLIASISCSKEERFDYSMDDLCGTWEGVAIKTSPEEGWYDITKYPFDKFAFSITFYSDGSYYGRGYFGNGKGTYKAFGNTIETYVDGTPYFTYKVKSLGYERAELTMSSSGSSIEIKVVKR